MQTSKIHSTKDYEKFKFFPSNRIPKHYHILQSSIERRDLTRYQPILVNESFYIIDGQNRFLACQNLGLPIYYIKGYGLKQTDMIILNNAQRVWNNHDYLRHWTAMGHTQYDIIKRALENTRLPISQVFRVGSITGLKRKKSEGQPTYTWAYQYGLIKFTEEHEKLCERGAELLDIVCTYTGEKYSLRTIFPVICQIVQNPKIDKKLLAEKFNKFYHLFRKQPDARGYLQNFEDVYNHFSQHKISFRD